MRAQIAVLFACVAIQTTAARPDDPRLRRAEALRVDAARISLVSRAAVLEGLKPPHEAAEETQQEVLDRAGVGPGPQPLRLHEQLPVRGLELFDLASLRDLATLSLEVFQDGNPASGIFYYAPRMYFLKWDDENDYYLTVDYKGEAPGGKNVVLDARLTPGEVENDVQLLKRLLRIYLAGQPATPERPPLDRIQVYPLPATPVAQFNWTALGVGADDVVVTGVDRDTGQLGLQVTTDLATKQILIKRLGDPQGLQGSVRIEPQRVTEGRPAPAAFSVDARLKLADTEAYARARWKRAAGDHSLFVNAHPFPVTLRHLAYLVETPGGLVLRGYDLQARRLAPGGVARVPNVRVGAEIDDGARVLRAWYRYRLENEGEYRDQVVDQLTGGVGVLPVKTAAIEVVRAAELFEQFHLFRVVVVVRSIHFDPDPESRDSLEHSYELSASEPRRALDPLYLRDVPGAPLYEYRIGVATDDGALHQDAEWRQPVPGFESMVVVGSSQIEQVLAQ